MKSKMIVIDKLYPPFQENNSSVISVVSLIPPVPLIPAVPLIPIVSVVPMYDENAMPVEVSAIRAHFLNAGLARLSDVGVVENWGIFEEAALYSSLLTLSYLDNDNLPGYIGSSIMIFTVRQKSDLLEELLSLGNYDSSDADKQKKILSKRLSSKETEYWSSPRKEHLLDWKLRKNLSEKLLAANKNKIRL